MLSSFPTVKLASVENGGNWAIPCLKALEKTYSKMPQAFDEHPRDVFLAQRLDQPVLGRLDSRDLVNLMTPEHVLFGSDYPHPEGMAEPLNFAKEIDGLFSEADTRKIMGENMFGLLGLHKPGVQAVSIDNIDPELRPLLDATLDALPGFEAEGLGELRAGLRAQSMRPH